MSKIEWTEKTWNPIVGCSVVSPGCTNCYAMKMAARIERMGGAPQYDGTTKQTRGGAVFTGKVALAEKALLEPLKRKKPTMYFVNSMGDLFHENVPDGWIDRVFAIMALCPQHTFQILTKRSKRMMEYCAGSMVSDNLSGRVNRIWQAVLDTPFKGKSSNASSELFAMKNGVPLPNVWLGVSTEDQTRADERIPDLLDTPAAVRFVSAEPLLGRIDFGRIPSPERWGENPDGWTFDCLQTGDYYTLFGDGPSLPSDGPWRDHAIDWIIAGGESGPGARVWDGFEDACRSLRDQCKSADVRFFMKQMAGVRKSSMPPIPDDLVIREVPK